MTRNWTLIGAALMIAGCAGGDGGGGSGPAHVDSGGDTTGGDQRIYGPCEEHVSSGTVTHVDIRVDSSLPTELGGSCAQGDPSELEGFIVFGAQNCLVDVGASGVSGCCMDIIADQNVTAVLTYRIAGQFTRIAEQEKYIELPATSDPVVDLSFAGEAVTDVASNRVDWCNGTL